MLWSYENPSVSDGVQRAAKETGLDDVSRYTLRRTLIAGHPMRAVLQDLDILTRRQQAVENAHDQITHRMRRCAAH
jgi:hypothetical protein